MIHTSARDSSRTDEGSGGVLFAIDERALCAPTLGHEGRQLLSESTIESHFTSATNFWVCAPSQRWDRAGASASIFQLRVRWTARSFAIRTASRTMQAAPGDGEASWIGTAMQNTTGGATLQISA
jgi:hypothetical protein